MLQVAAAFALACLAAMPAADAVPLQFRIMQDAAADGSVSYSFRLLKFWLSSTYTAPDGSKYPAPAR